MDWWNNRSDEYYGGIQKGIDDVFDRADRAFPVVVWEMIRSGECRRFSDSILNCNMEEYMSIIKTHDITLYGGNDTDIVLHPLCDYHLPLLYKWCTDPEVLY